MNVSVHQIPFEFNKKFTNLATCFVNRDLSLSDSVQEIESYDQQFEDC